MSTVTMPKKKLSYYEKVQLLTNNTTTKKWLLYFGKYVFQDTVEGAAKAYFGTLLTDGKYKAMAQKLGLK